MYDIIKKKRDDKNSFVRIYLNFKDEDELL